MKLDRATTGELSETIKFPHPLLFVLRPHRSAAIDLFIDNAELWISMSLANLIEIQEQLILTLYYLDA